ncbi:MAG: RNA polymerase sigma factor [Planctomycetota bacterium]
MLTTTSTILLQGLSDPANDAAWGEFVGRYFPVIVAFARKLGLDPDDAADSAQETLARFVRDYRAGKYDRERGRLRSWIFAIARSCVADSQRSSAARRQWRGESALADFPAEDTLAELWEAQWRAEILRQGIAELRETTKTDPQTVRVLELLALEQRPAAEVAAQLEMTVGAVYVAKHRALERLRAIVLRLEEQW